MTRPLRSSLIIPLMLVPILFFVLPTPAHADDEVGDAYLEETPEPTPQPTPQPTPDPIEGDLIAEAGVPPGDLEVAAADSVLPVQEGGEEEVVSIQEMPQNTEADPQWVANDDVGGVVPLGGVASIDNAAPEGVDDSPLDPMQPSPYWEPICPAEEGCIDRVVVPIVQPPPPRFACPLPSCDPFYVLVQELRIGGEKPHWGVDLWTGVDGPLYAPASARVIYTGNYRQCGGMVALDYGGGWWSRICHFTQIAVVPGQTVHTGQFLGLIGDSGYTLDRGHVHFEVWWAWTPYDVLAMANGS